MRGIIDKLNRQRTKKPLNIRLGIWGTAGSGKTTYLAMLYDCLQKDDKWIAELVQQDFLPIIRKNITRITKDRKFPDPTMTNIDDDSGINIFSYAIMPKKSSIMGESTITLSFIDAPGEFYENLSETEVKVVKNEDEEGQEKKYESIVDYLINCHGMILLIDPMRSLQKSKSYYDLLIELLEECKNRYFNQYQRVESRLLPQYMAFCVSKIDSTMEEGSDLWEKAEDPIELAREVMSEELFAILNNFCYFDLEERQDPSRNRCNFYGVSSIGRYFDSKTERFVSIVEEHLEQDTPVGEDNNQESSIDESSIDPEDDWEDWGKKEENISTQNHQPGARIREGVKIQPMNVTAPIEWLIRSIQANPPF